MPNPETGITPLPDGSEVHWSREEVTPEAARLLADYAAAEHYRVVTLSERDATSSACYGELPGEVVRSSSTMSSRGRKEILGRPYVMLQRAKLEHPKRLGAGPICGPVDPVPCRPVVHTEGFRRLDPVEVAGGLVASLNATPHSSVTNGGT